MELLQTARKFYTGIRATSAYKLWQEKLPAGKFWDMNFTFIERVLTSAKDARDAVRLISDTLLYQVNTHEEARRELAVDWNLALLREKGVDVFALPEYVQDHDLWPAKIIDKRHGRRFTPDFFRVFNFARSIATHYPDMPENATLLELGAGLGHLARLIKLQRPGVRYCIIDLPETLAFSYMYLSLCFPEKTIVLAQSHEEVLRHLNAPYDFLLIPTILADSVNGAHFDLFVNTCSLGEMRNETVRYWMDFIQQRNRVDHLYLVNRFLNVIRADVDTARFAENVCMLCIDRDWEVTQWQLEPDYMRCPYHGFAHPRYLEVFARRKCQWNDATAEAQSYALLAQVMQQEWIHSGNISNSWINGAFSVDTSQHGVIFKMWEALRLNPNHDMLLAMLRYVDIRGRNAGMEFEEVFFWEAELERRLAAHPERREGKWLKNRRIRREIAALAEQCSWGASNWRTIERPSLFTVLRCWVKMGRLTLRLWRNPDFDISAADYSQSRLQEVLYDEPRALAA